jgi:hypothetical protein
VPHALAPEQLDAEMMAFSREWDRAVDGSPNLARRRGMGPGAIVESDHAFELGLIEVLCGGERSPRNFFPRPESARKD